MIIQKIPPRLWNAGFVSYFLAQTIGRMADHTLCHGIGEGKQNDLQCEGSAGKVTLTQTKKAWAAELGVSHESLYRTLSNMQRCNRITLHNNDIALINP